MENCLLYEEHARQAWAKVIKMPDAIKRFVQGGGYGVKRVFIHINEDIPTEMYEKLKREVENDYVTVEVKKYFG
jgi:hypothetical protein